MKLSEVNLTKMLPAFMKEDQYDVLFAEAFSNLFKKLSLETNRIVIIGQVDSLNEAELDQLAYDMNIFWYNTQVDISIKRQLIKNSNLVFSRLGTVWAVESVINDYLPNTELQEWFDYGGEPHHFRLITNDTAVLTSQIKLFIEILEKIKRKSQWLEQIILQLRAQGQLYPGIGILERSIDKIKFEN